MRRRITAASWSLLLDIVNVMRMWYYERNCASVETFHDFVLYVIE
jgi:hypothetical protein